MKKRILAIILMLMLAVSLLPVAAMADDGIYVSIGGKAFTALNQTIKVGGGTATISRPGEFFELVLNDVNINQFDNLGSEAGVTYYAGIAISGERFVIITFNNCTITVPSHGADAYYDGIYSDSVVEIRGNITIKNADVGIEAYGVQSKGTNISISTSSGPALYVANDISLYNNCSCDIQTSSNYAIVSASFRNDGDTTINQTPDCAKYGYSEVCAITAYGNINLGKTTINMNADLSGYQGSELLNCSAVATASWLAFNDNASISMNVKGNENVVVEGAFADMLLVKSGRSLSNHINMSGSHANAVGIACMRYDPTNQSEVNTPVIDSIITGAHEDDVAFYVEEWSRVIASDVYASVDCDSAAAIQLNPECGGIYGADGNTPLNIFAPKNGEFKNVPYGDEEVLTVTDANGIPANVVVLSSKAYAFRDIDDASDAPYKNAILWAVDKGITTGFTPVEFRPSAECTRGQVVTFLWRAKGCPEPTITENPFVDVASNSPFYKAILWAYENGITTGFDATHFKPSNPCTRAQVVTFLWRSEGKPAPETVDNPFEDVSAEGNTAPYYEAILWAAENGITSGYGNGEFRPNVTCNRGQIVTFIYRDMKE